MSKGNVTSVDQYRKMIGEEKIVTAPSGAVFKVKTLSVMDYVKNGLGDLPNEFFSFIKELSDPKKIQDVDENSKESKKHIDFFGKYMTISIEKGIIAPKVVYEYKKKKKLHDALLFGELKQEDQTFLLNVITGKSDE